MNAQKILVLAPNWVGDAVMATPALDALKKRFPDSKIVLAARPYVTRVFDGLDIIDEVRGLESLKKRCSLRGFVSEAWSQRKEGFDLAVLFCNSFRSALFSFLAGAKERVGYAREGRGFLLTKSMKPLSEDGKFVPGPMVDYYLGLVGLAGADTSQGLMRLTVTETDRAEADEVFRRAGMDSAKKLAVINPGAAFGSAKCWPAENFAGVADALAERGFEVAVVTGPREKDIAEAIATAAKSELKTVWRFDVGLGALKSIIERAAVLVTNDSGPRHFAAAFGVPVVTIIGPTDPRWSDTRYRGEIVVRKQVDCGPCMGRTCPRDHKCMVLITQSEVIRAVSDVLLLDGKTEVTNIAD